MILVSIHSFPGVYGWDHEVIGYSVDCENSPSTAVDEAVIKIEEW